MWDLSSLIRDRTCARLHWAISTGPSGKSLSLSFKQVPFQSRTLTIGRVPGLLTSLGSVEKELLLSVGESVQPPNLGLDDDHERVWV